MSRTSGRVGILLLALASFTSTARDASAQTPTFDALAEAGGDEVHLLFAQLGLAASGLGLRPVASVGAYMVFANGANSWGVIPAGALRYVTEGGFIEGKAGWVFVDEDASPYFGGRESGFLSAFSAEFLGEAFSAGGTMSYNWGADYFWSHARLARSMGNMGAGGTWGLGAELTYQAETEDPLVGVAFNATQVGPVLILTPRTGGPSFILGGGWKKTEFGVGDESTWYAKGEIHLR